MADSKPPEIRDTKALATVLAVEAKSVLGRRAVRVLGVLALLAVVVVVLSLLLDWYIDPTKPNERKDLVLTLAQILGGAALLSGLYFTWRTLGVNREGQITERFTRAIDQLGSQKLEIKLGGIYALERIVKDSPKDNQAVMEVLTAYIRANAPRSLEEAQDNEQDVLYSQQKEPPADIRAIVHVVRRRDEDCIPEKYRLRLDLSKTNLSGADLSEADLGGAYLKYADLRGAYLSGVDFSEADPRYANLRGASLGGSNFKGAYLRQAKFRRADLSGADLGGAYLEGAELTYAILREELTSAQLKNLFNSSLSRHSETTLPSCRKAVSLHRCGARALKSK
jgi:hypothetical protein